MLWRTSLGVLASQQERTTFLRIPVSCGVVGYENKKLREGKEVTLYEMILQPRRHRTNDTGWSAIVIGGDC